MKTCFWLVPIALLLIGGCETHEGSSGWNGFDGEVQIALLWDDVYFIPGDSVVVPGQVVVTDRDRTAIAGKRVRFIVQPPELGCIAFADSILRDTTNAQGRVDFGFLSYSRRGDIMIIASVDHVSDSCVLHVRESGHVDSSICIAVNRTLVRYGEGQADSVLVSVVLRDSAEAGMPNIVPVLVSDTGGRVGTIPPTNLAGHTEAWWWPACCGYQYIRACHGALSAEVCVFVDSL
jgi:hypothetical protein